MRSIVEAVFEHARQQPERAAIVFEHQVISYARLYADIERFARALLAWGLAPGDRVALYLENSPTFIIAYLGTQLAGGIVVLVNTQYRKVELGHILQDAGVRLCVTEATGAAEVRRLALPALETLVVVGDMPGTDETVAESAVPQCAYADILAGARDTAHGALPMPDNDAAAILGYTSGTTGRAKGALLLHRKLLANAEAVTTAWHWTEDDRLLLVLPLFHAHGLMVGLHGTLLRGASLVLRRRFDAGDVLAILRDDPEVTMFFGVPTMYGRLLAEAAGHGVPSHRLRLYVSGSAPLSPHVFTEFEQVFGARILERYGMTETIMNLTNPYEGERRPGTVGGPFPGQEARVVDVRNRLPLPAGEIGEIEVRGPHVFAGYWNRPEATTEVLSSDGWFKTGDLGWRSEDGYYTITGRARELIISGGYNVYPREVEDLLATHPDVTDVAVIGLPDADLGERVVAVVVPREGRSPSVEDITTFCRERLAGFKKPRQVEFVGALPRNALGKVQKHLLIAELTAR